MKTISARQSHYRINLCLLILSICSLFLLIGAIVYQIIAGLIGIKTTQSISS